MFALTDMKMTATCLLLPDVFGDDPSLFVIVNEKVCTISVIAGLTFHLFLFESRMVVSLEVCCVTFTNMLICNKLIYYNKSRHLVLFSYFTLPFFFFQVQVSTPVLEVKNPFNIDVCEFSLYLEKERLTKVDDCVTALAALVAAFHVFGIQCPSRLSQTLNFLETQIFDMHSPYVPSMKEKEKEVGFQHPAT